MKTTLDFPTTNPNYVEPDYPTSDGRPMGETDLHRQVMIETIDGLIDYFAGQRVYVTGDLLVYYERGNRRKHVSPDAMVVRGAEMRPRDYYLLWEEGLFPNAVVEITSKSTRREDQVKKMQLYRDVLKVREYFLFDPTSDYLNPRLQGHRLVNGEYVRIDMHDGRLTSVELGLELEAEGKNLRLRDPATGKWLPTRAEAREQADLAREQADLAREQADEARARLEAENERLRHELEQLKRQQGGSAP